MIAATTSIMKDSNVSGRSVVAVLAIAYCLSTPVECWSICSSFHIEGPPLQSKMQHGTVISNLSHMRNLNRIMLRAVPPIINDDSDADNFNVEQQRNEFGRANRRRVRTLQRDEEVDSDDVKNMSTRSGSNNNDDDEFLWNGRFRSDRSGSTTDQEQFTDTDGWDEFEDDDDENDVDEYDIDETKRYDLLENIIIPNPLLDSIDPDGTVERLPELLSDPRFWFDMVIFILFLDFLSFAGPQSDPFIDFPWIY